MAFLPFLAAGALTAGATVGASLGTAAFQEKNSEALQNKQFAYNNSVIERGEKSFTDVGLPKFLYYNGQLGSSLPNTQTHLGGTAFAQSYGVNSNLPYYSSHPETQYLGLGKPRPTTVNSRDSTGATTRPGIGFVNQSSSQGTTPSVSRSNSFGSIEQFQTTSGMAPDEHQKFLDMLYNNNKGTQFNGITRSIGTQAPGPRPKILSPTQPKWVPFI